MKLKRLFAIATTFAMALGTIGLTGFANNFQAFADENPSLGGENGDMLYDLMNLHGRDSKRATERSAISQ